MFVSPSKGQMDLPEVVADILNYISQDIDYTYKLIVGTDSHPHDNGAACFVSAIIIHRLGKGARYFYRRHQENIINMRQRIFYETSLSLELADQLTQCLKDRGRDDMKVEIHLDVGTHGDTRDLVKEVIGMVVGSGFDAQIKPNSCGASKVADKYTR